jgi:hypothetical protein
MEMESSLGRARFRGTVSLSFRDLGNPDVLSQIFLENERGGDGAGGNRGWGEQITVNRVMQMDGRFRFNFPTALRAFISSRDKSLTSIYGS